jgi:hypothetical protein
MNGNSSLSMKALMAVSPQELHVIPAGGTPAEFEIEADQDEYNNVDFAGLDFYPEQRATGPYRDDEWDFITTGGFQIAWWSQIH